jgi:hypothetical protein
MISDLDNTLKKLLAKEVPSLDEEHFHFDAPGDEFNPHKPSVNLFLYDVRENRELLSNEWLVERNAGMVTKTPPPVRVDCSYLITAWAGDIESEHRLLGQVMKALLRYPTLPRDILQGELAAGKQEEQSLPLPTATLQSGRLQSLAEFWQAIGGKPKAVLHYTVTIGVQPYEAAEAGPPVTETVLKLRQERKTPS